MAFARGHDDHLEYAIKFFLVRESFEAEQKLYQSQALGSLLPQVLALQLIRQVLRDVDMRSLCLAFMVRIHLHVRYACGTAGESSTVQRQETQSGV